MRSMDEDKVFECQRITKSFYNNKVLDDVNLVCTKGRILGLIGENGAGKTTLINIISANISSDGGTMLYHNQSYRFSSPHEARDMGIVVVHQLLSLIPELSVGENIMLGYEPKNKLGGINNQLLHEQAKEILESIGFQIDVYSLVSTISPAQRQMVEIAKAISTSPKLLILDEPTSSLSTVEVEQFFELIRHLASQGVSIIFISHRLDEVFTICDEVVVLKDGKMIMQSDIGAVTKEDLVNAMVGREVTHKFPDRNSVISSEITLRLKNVHLNNKLKGISLKVPKGSIIGIAGLEGQGQRYLARGLFGIEQFPLGSVEFGGCPVNITNPRKAMSLGIAYISEDRDAEGVVKVLSVSENIVLTTHKDISHHTFINNRLYKTSVEDGVRQLSIKVSNVDDAVGFLSGGNQQKVVFAKWLKTQPKLLVLHEPTRGIDVQTKIEIYHLLRRLTQQGLSVILFSSDMLELIGLSDKIFVMYEGCLTGSISGSDATEEKIMKLSSGMTLNEVI